MNGIGEVRFDYHLPSVHHKQSQESQSPTNFTYASEKDPVTKECAKDDFPTARNPRMATLRWTKVGSLPFTGILSMPVVDFTLFQVK